MGTSASLLPTTKDNSSNHGSTTMDTSSRRNFPALGGGDARTQGANDHHDDNDGESDGIFNSSTAGCGHYCRDGTVSSQADYYQYDGGGCGCGRTVVADEEETSNNAATSKTWRFADVGEGAFWSLLPRFSGIISVLVVSILVSFSCLIL